MNSIKKGIEVLLASKSPRRQQLLKDMGIRFRLIPQEAKEEYPDDLPVNEIASYLARLKAQSVKEALQKPQEVILTSDTTVVLGNKEFGKPVDLEEAKAFLRELSGQKHEVITAVCLLGLQQEILMTDTTEVYFEKLEEEEIDYYVSQFRPLDKAGGYGIQEWIGLNKITKIEGSYFTVVGLPTHLLYEGLRQYAAQIY